MVFISFLSIDIGWYYFFITMLIIFTLKGTSSEKIGVLTMQAYPNAFKWLVAPIIDTYFIQKIGKRKTSGRTTVNPLNLGWWPEEAAKKPCMMIVTTSQRIHQSYIFSTTLPISNRQSFVTTIVVN